MKLIMSTCPENEAENLAEGLLRMRLVACVNIVPGIISKYWWKGILETDREVLLLMKTTPELVERVVAKIKELHSYEVPEVVVLDIREGNQAYFKWIMDVTHERA